MRWMSVISILVVSACGGAGGGLASVSTSTCASGKQWQGGNEESPLMHPGRDCIGCHASSREAPAFLLAGTVFPDTSSADDCGGVQGVDVQVTGADGTVHHFTTNEAGNFYMTSRDGTLTKPYTVVLSKDGRTRAMGDAQSNGSCNTCHGAAQGSSGITRIQAP